MNLITKVSDKAKLRSYKTTGLNFSRCQSQENKEKTKESVQTEWD